MKYCRCNPARGPINILSVWAAAMATFFSLNYGSRDITIPHEGAYDPDTHLSLVNSDVAVKVPLVISILINQSKINQGRQDMYLPSWPTCHRGEAIQTHFYNGTTLAKPKFVGQVRSALTAANLPAKDFAGDSFRIGAAIMAATAGLDDSTIQSVGR